MQKLVHTVSIRPPGEDPAGCDEPPAAMRGSSLVLLLQKLRTKDRASESAYEDLRRRLIVFFQLHVPAEAEALADATFDRLTHKLEEGIAIRDARQYALGIARMLLLEARARLGREKQASDDPTFAPDYDEERSQRKELVFAALTDCLQQLPPSSRRLVLAYYDEAGVGHIQARRKLALDYGISLNALKNRILRLRQTLEGCVSDRLKQG